MSARPRFHLSGWLVGSFFSLLVVNFFLMLFVGGVDVFLGQPPQFMFPLFALLIIFATLMLGRGRRGRAEEVPEAELARVRTSATQKTRRYSEKLPAYHSMIIIKRPSVYASTPVSDDWKGAVQ